MRKVLICCSGGITSKFFIRKLNQYVDIHNIMYNFSSISETFIMKNHQKYDIILFAPQSQPHHDLFNQLQELHDFVGIIPDEIYANMNCEQLIDFIENPIKTNQKKYIKIIDILSSFSKNKYVSLLVRASLSMSGLLIVQSIFSLLLSIPFEGYQFFLINTNIKGILEIPISVLSSLIALFFNFTITYSSNEEKPDVLFISLLSVSCYLILIPIQMKEQGILDTIYTVVIELQYLNFSGVFTAIVSALVFTKIYGIISAYLKKYNSFVKNSILCFIMLLLFLCIRCIFMVTEFENIFNFINSGVSILFNSISFGIGGFAVYIFLSSLLFFFGIHGPQLLYTLILPMYMTMYYANTDAFAQGIPAPYPYWFMIPWVFIGGVGSTLALNILMILKSKNESLKTLGKISLMTSVFNINEPIIFGLPITYNPLFIIPFTLTPIINLLICYLFMVAIPVVPLPTGAEINYYIPIGFNAMFTNGNILGLLLHVLLLIVDIFVYYPFFTAFDSQIFIECKKRQT